MAPARGLGCKVQDLRVSGVGFGVSGLGSQGFEVSGLGFLVWGLGSGAFLHPRPSPAPAQRPAGFLRTRPGATSCHPRGSPGGPRPCPSPAAMTLCQVVAGPAELRGR